MNICAFGVICEITDSTVKLEVSTFEIFCLLIQVIDADTDSYFIILQDEQQLRVYINYKWE